MSYKNFKNIWGILLCISAFVSGDLNAADVDPKNSYQEWKTNIRNFLRDHRTVSQPWRDYVMGFQAGHPEVSKWVHYSLHVIRELDTDLNNEYAKYHALDQGYAKCLKQLKQCEGATQEVGSGKRRFDYINAKHLLNWLKGFVPRKLNDQFKNLWTSKSSTLPARKDIQQSQSEE